MRKEDICPNKGIDKVEDVIKAVDIALVHLMIEGIVAFRYEITSVFKRCSAWFVMIEGKPFNGVVIISSKTGEVRKVVQL